MYFFVLKECDSTSERDEAAAASAQPQPPQTNNNCSDCASTVKTMLETFGKQQQELLINLDRQRREDIGELERRRMQDKTENHENMCHLWKQWQTDKQDIIHNNELKIAELQIQVNDFQRGSAEFNFLKEKYDHLKEQQKGMREKDDERQARLHDITHANEELKIGNRKLGKEIRHVSQNLCESDENNILLEEDKNNSEEYIATLENKIRELEEELKRRHLINKELKSDLEKHHSDIQDIFLQQRETTKIDDPEFVQTVEQHNKKLDAIYGILQNISSGKGQRLMNKEFHKAGKKIAPRTSYTSALRESRTGAL